MQLSMKLDRKCLENSHFYNLNTPNEIVSLHKVNWKKRKTIYVLRLNFSESVVIRLSFRIRNILLCRTKARVSYVAYSIA